MILEVVWKYDKDNSLRDKDVGEVLNSWKSDRGLSDLRHPLDPPLAKTEHQPETGLK